MNLLRKTVVLLFIIMAQNSKGQDLLQLNHQLYSLFDSSKLSTNILIDKSPNFSAIGVDSQNFDSLQTDITAWRQAYLDLYNGQYANNISANSLPPLHVLDSITEFYRERSIQPISILLKNFNKIDDSAYVKEEITYDTISDRLDFSEFPYTSSINELLYFNSSPNIPYTENDTLRLIIPLSNIFSDINIQNISIAIDELNTNVNISPNEVLTIPITEISQEITKFNITVSLQVNSRFYRASFLMKRFFPVTNPDQIQYNFNVPGACTINAPKGFAEARAYIVWANPNTFQIKKPLILVEGYDPSPMDYGAIGWRTLSEGFSFNEKAEPVYPQLKKMPDLATALTAANYDIIFVDFKNSEEDLERNAATLAKVIQWVNFVTTGDNEPVLLGASLGGVICQTAMNILEQSNCKSCIDAFVSFDTPFLGANVPLGIQELVKFAATSLDLAQTQYNVKLNTPAAKQLLYYHINGIQVGRDWHDKFSKFNKRIANRNICFTSGIPGPSSLGINDGDELLAWEVFNMFTAKQHVDVHVYSKNRIDNMTLQMKVPANYAVLKIPFVGPKRIGVTKYASHTAYCPNELISLPNFDNSSGGMANYIGEVLEELMKETHDTKAYGLMRRGPIAPKGDWHCFVPTISALDIEKNNQSIVISSINRNKPAPFHPFDQIRFSDNNQVHVQITDKTISDLIDVLVSNHQKVVGIVSNNFNYSASKFSTLYSITISPQASVSFNDYSLSNYGNQSTDIYPKFEDIFVRSSNCGTYVSCESSGNLILGGYSPSSTELKAQVEFRKGSTLELQSDAVLRIRDNSILIIEEGATLIYHPGAKIYLEGENAVLEIRGTLQLQNDAVFSFEKGNAAKGGFVRFTFSDNDPNHIKAMGTNCRINLVGETYFSDKILELSSNTKLTLPYSLNTSSLELAEFRMLDGIVEYIDGASIDVGCATYLKNVHFNQEGAQFGTGLITHGQANLTLEDCHFNLLNLGMKANNNDLGNNLSITNNRFFSCNDGLHTIGRNVEIELGSISNCGFGLLLEGTQDAIFEGTEFIYNAFGLETRGSNGHIRIEDAWFLKNTGYGIFDLNETKFTVECTPFEENTVGLYTNGKVNMSPIFLYPGQTLGGGNNTFFNNQTSIELQYGEVQLKNGGNNFIVPSTFVGPPNFLIGSLTASASYIPNNLLDATGNYFSNLPTGGIGTGSGNLYALTSYGGSGVNGASVLLNGAVLPTMNNVCFNFPRIYPNNKKAIEFSPEEYDFVKDNRLQQLKAYPNPSSDIITLEGYSAVNGVQDIILYDMQGKEIYQSKWAIIAGTNRLQLSLKNIIDPGVYMLKVIGSDGSSQVVRISLSY